MRMMRLRLWWTLSLVQTVTPKNQTVFNIVPIIFTPNTIAYFTIPIVTLTLNGAIFFLRCFAKNFFGVLKVYTFIYKIPNICLCPACHSQVSYRTNRQWISVNLISWQKIAHKISPLVAFLPKTCSIVTSFTNRSVHQVQVFIQVFSTQIQPH